GGTSSRWSWSQGPWGQTLFIAFPLRSVIAGGPGRSPTCAAQPQEVNPGDPGPLVAARPRSQATAAARVGPARAGRPGPGPRPAAAGPTIRGPQKSRGRRP